MRIANSTLSFQSSQYSQKLEAKVEASPLFVGWGLSYTGQPQFFQTDRVTISLRAQQAFLESQQTFISGSGAAGEVAAPPNHSAAADENQIKAQVLNRMYHGLTGQNITFVNPSDLFRFGGAPRDFATQLAVRQKAKADWLSHYQAAPPPQSPQASGSYWLHETVRESEMLSFKAQGVVETVDGKRIDIAAQLKMSRDFAVQHQIDFEQQLEPFDIKGLTMFADTVAQLQNTRFSFKIDSNGQEGQIASLLKLDGGYLGLDSDGDGLMSPAELIGGENGNAFAALAAYDGDQNGWIDEGDSIYDQLRIWTGDAPGHDQLFALGQKGIGAICLANIEFPDEIKDQNDQTEGQIQRSGIYVHEDGSTGFIQQIDLLA